MQSREGSDVPWLPFHVMSGRGKASLEKKFSMSKDLGILQRDDPAAGTEEYRDGSVALSMRASNMLIRSRRDLNLSGTVHGGVRREVRDDSMCGDPARTCCYPVLPGQTRRFSTIEYSNRGA